MRVALFLALALTAFSAWGDDERGGGFDLVLEGGALGGARSMPSTFAPVAQVDVLGRARVAKHLALTGGLTTLPVPQVFALGALGRLEWLPLADEPLRFSAFVGGRLLVLQPMCVSGPSPACGTGAGGVLAEIGVAFRTVRTSGYRWGLALSAVAGAVAPYDDLHSLRAFYVGGIAGLGVTF